MNVKYLYLTTKASEIPTPSLNETFNVKGRREFINIKIEPTVQAITAKNRT